MGFSLDQQVCSLDLAKRLKELGVKQLDNSLWAWTEVAQHEKDELGRPKWKYEVRANYFQADIEFIAAFTVAELGEMLPQGYEFEFYHTVRGPHRLDYKEFNHSKHWVEADTEANARAKMLIYLIEQGIVKP